MNVVFTNHAIKRIRERFGPHSRKPVPYKLLRLIGSTAKADRFRVTIDGVRYVLAKSGFDLVVVTVIKR